MERFVEGLFTKWDKFLVPPRHPKWRDVNLAATVPGWTRWSVANEMLKRVQPKDTTDGQVAEFSAFLNDKSSAAGGSVYAVSGLALGARVQFDSSAYREYECGPSDQFDGFIWCQKTRWGKERRGSFNVTHSILHSRDGSVLYVNRYQEPAFWGPNEVDQDIKRYSRKIGEQPRIITLPSRAGLPNGILATWGKVVLEPLDNESLMKLAEGGRPTIKGYFIDFIGDFARSAKEGLPVYRLSGGAGFVWVASYDKKGRGTLRFSAVDASTISPQLVATQAEQRSQGSPTIAPLPPITADKAEQRKLAEAKASRNLANAPLNLQFLMKGLRAADDFIKLAEETFLAVFNDVQPEEFTDESSFNVTNGKSTNTTSITA